MITAVTRSQLQSSSWDGMWKCLNIQRFHREKKHERHIQHAAVGFTTLYCAASILSLEKSRSLIVKFSNHAFLWYTANSKIETKAGDVQAQCWLCKSEHSSESQQGWDAIYYMSLTTSPSSLRYIKNRKVEKLMILNKTPSSLLPQSQNKLQICDSSLPDSFRLTLEKNLISIPDKGGLFTVEQ